VVGGAEVVVVPDETDVEDETGAAARGGAFEQPAANTTASTRTLRAATTPSACLITNFTRLSYMVKLTPAALNEEGREQPTVR
jgi:hypothetical protein